MLRGDVGFRGDMTLQLTTIGEAIGEERHLTLESARHFGSLAYRKLASTERRAFVILLQRPGSAVLRI